MTVQLKDTIFPLEEEGFSIDTYTGDAPFDISEYFERPFISFSACWKGYTARFIIKDDKLLLKDLRVFKIMEKPKIINGVTPKFLDFFDSKIPYYENLGLEMKYSGRMLLKKGYEKLGLRPIFDIATSKQYTELVFSSGILQKKEDLTDLIEEFRQALFDHAKEEFKNGNLLKMLDASYAKRGVKKYKKTIELMVQESEKLILEEKLSELSREVAYTVFENFTLKDPDLNKEFHQRFFLNYGHSGYGW